jgi:hypothetical protein
MNVLQGKDGKTSAMRVLTAIVVGTVMGVWAIANIICWIRGCQYVALDAQAVALVVGVMAAKAGQSFAEHKDIPKDLTQ